MKINKFNSLQAGSQSIAFNIIVTVVILAILFYLLRGDKPVPTPPKQEPTKVQVDNGQTNNGEINHNQAVDGPHINSITPLSGPIGTVIDVEGEKLSGFEGDLILIFERSDGVKFNLTDNFGDYAKTQDKRIRVTVKEPCQKGETVYGAYSGIPSVCNYVAMTPGKYKVYTEPWGKKSNVVEFTVTK